MIIDMDCEPCPGPGGDAPWRDGLCRAIRVTEDAEDAPPGFCRVVWCKHAPEMNANNAAQARPGGYRFRNRARRASGCPPDKVNLAGLLPAPTAEVSTAKESP